MEVGSPDAQVTISYACFNLTLIVQGIIEAEKKFVIPFDTTRMSVVEKKKDGKKHQVEHSREIALVQTLEVGLPIELSFSSVNPQILR